MSGNGIGKALGGGLLGGGLLGGGVTKAVSGLLGGGQKPAKIVDNTKPAQDTAQEEVDKKQQIVNTAKARKKNRSILSTGAISSDAGAANQAQSKRLLGE